ncbi:MAG: phospholipase D-like domain-containing protein [Candidatus Omnitrophica bacterium]|nr:phospholipase D-like domain-containing protein [Candidatus Omnitrophota bacterium]
MFFPFNVSADVLFGKSYHQILHKYLIQSKSSITVAMYFIIINPADKTDPINELVNDLIIAKNRGVKIKVILEDSKLKENRLAYEKLRANNITVYFDTAQHLLHIKEVVIDDRYVFAGSANWSKAAIEDNYEATYFKDSARDALVSKQYIDNIPIQKKDIFLPQVEGVAISPDFLLAPNSGRRLLKAEAFKQFDLYLLLCELQQETARSSLDIDYDSLAGKMGYQAPVDLGKYRDNHHYFYERIHRSLKRLKGYGLIDYNKGKVILKADNSKKAGAHMIIIPFEYWEYGYSDSLSMRAKYIYLICLYEASHSTRYPFWFRSQEDMSKLYGISDTTISLGLLELEKKGIIEITRDKPKPPDFSDRKANIYRMLSLTRSPVEG